MSSFFASYIATLAVVGISWIVKGFIDLTCGHNICVTTSEKFKDFMYAGICFLAIIVMTKFHQLKEAWERISHALQALQQPPPTTAAAGATKATKPKQE